MHRQSDAISVFCKIAAWLIVGAGLVGCADTTVRRLYEPTPDVLTELSDPIKALSYVSTPFDEKASVGYPCSVAAPLIGYSVSGAKISVKCPDNSEHTLTYRDNPLVYVGGENYEPWACVKRRPETACLLGVFSDLDKVTHFVKGWYVLSQPRSPKDPTTDAQFRDAIQRTPSDGRDRPEELRRYQVQVENALKENRGLDAVLIYREASAKVPAWPQGHFNLSLLYEGLELYPEAITEMRRYLYLLPGAPDARAAQDKIYEWEGKIAKISAVP